MKIYKPEPIDLVRVQISKSGEKTEYITFHETTQSQVMDNLKKTCEPFAMKFPEGPKIRVDVREAKGGKNGKSKSFHFYGMISPSNLIEKINYEYGY